MNKNEAVKNLLKITRRNLELRCRQVYFCKNEVVEDYYHRDDGPEYVLVPYEGIEEWHDRKSTVWQLDCHIFARVLVFK